MLRLPEILQDKGHDCGEAAVRCVLAFHGVTAPARIACQIDGTDPRTLEIYLRRLGCLVTSGEMSTDDLRHFCGDGRPVVCLVTNPGEGSHWVTVRGVSRSRVYFMDPWDGSGNASVKDWEVFWTATGRLGETYKRWGVVVTVPERQ